MQVLDLNDEHMRFVASCTHMQDLDEETERAREVRESWLKDYLAKGLKVKVVVDNGEPFGFAHCLPIEMGCSGIAGKDLMTIPCLTLKNGRVYNQQRGSGYGRALMNAVELEAKNSDKKGVAVLAFDHQCWFMPAPFFLRLDYREVDRDGAAVLMLKAFADVTPPVIRKLKYTPQLTPGKVTVDVFWAPLCLTSIVEIRRVREVCATYGDKVICNEFNGADIETLEKYQTARAIFINGTRKDWGCAAPRDELKQEIDNALAAIA
jgi:GNAT superfamily N-acetyltransferase